MVTRSGGAADGDPPPPPKRARRSGVEAAGPSRSTSTEEPAVQQQAVHADAEAEGEPVAERGMTADHQPDHLAAEAMPDAPVLVEEDSLVGSQVQAKLRSLIGFIAGDPDATWGKLLCDTPQVRRLSIMGQPNPTVPVHSATLHLRWSSRTTLPVPGAHGVNTPTSWTHLQISEVDPLSPSRLGSRSGAVETPSCLHDAPSPPSVHLSSSCWSALCLPLCLKGGGEAHLGRGEVLGEGVGAHVLVLRQLTSQHHAAPLGEARHKRRSARRLRHRHPASSQRHPASSQRHPASSQLPAITPPDGEGDTAGSHSRRDAEGDTRETQRADGAGRRWARRTLSCADPARRWAAAAAAHTCCAAPWSPSRCSAASGTWCVPARGLSSRETRGAHPGPHALSHAAMRRCTSGES